MAGAWRRPLNTASAAPEAHPTWTRGSHVSQNSPLLGSISLGDFSRCHFQPKASEPKPQRSKFLTTSPVVTVREPALKGAEPPEIQAKAIQPPKGRRGFPSTLTWAEAPGRPNQAIAKVQAHFP